MTRKNSSAKIEANNRWVRENYDRISVTLPKGMREELRKQAESMGKTMNSFSRDAICDAIRMCEEKKWRTVEDAKKFIHGGSGR